MDKNQFINYKNLIQHYRWIIKKNQPCIISPDIDGLLSGLFMSHYYNWKIVGYYDGKQLVVKKKNNIKNCIFLDMEIFRKEIRSLGHHIVLYNKNDITPLWNENFSNCINPNILRQHDAYNHFKEKYPFATIHFLLCITSSNGKKIKIPKDAIPLLLYVDGTFKNLLNYPENCVSWLKYLRAKYRNSPIYHIYSLFKEKKLSEIIHELERLFKKFKQIGGGKIGGDKLKISDIKLVHNNKLPQHSINKLKNLLNLITQLTQWKFKIKNWAITGLKIIKCRKKISEKLTNKKFKSIIYENPFSLAITASKRIEYTLLNIKQK